MTKLGGDYWRLTKDMVEDNCLTPGLLATEYEQPESVTALPIGSPAMQKLIMEISMLQNQLISSNMVIAVLCKRAGGKIEIRDEEFIGLVSNKAPRARTNPENGNMIIEIDE